MEISEHRRQALKALADQLGRGGIRSIAEKIGKDANYVSRMLYPADKKGSKGIGEDTALLLARAYPEFFSGPRRLFQDEVLPINAYQAEEHEDDRETITIKQFDTGGAMGGGFVLRDQPGVIKSWTVNQEWAIKNLPYYTSADNLAIVTGFGDSMLGMFNPGDPLLVDRGITRCDVDGVYFFRVDDEGFIKRLQRIPGEGILVISENEKYRDWTIKPAMNFQVLAKVLTVWKSQHY